MPPRFQPRRYLIDPDRFGRDPDALWMSAPTNPPEQRARYQMSQQQHQAACDVLAKLTARGQPLSWLADQLAEDPHYLRRKLHGQVPMRLEDWYLWTEFTGPPRDGLSVDGS